MNSRSLGGVLLSGCMVGLLSGGVTGLFSGRLNAEPLFIGLLVLLLGFSFFQFYLSWRVSSILKRRLLTACFCVDGLLAGLGAVTVGNLAQDGAGVLLGSAVFLLLVLVIVLSVWKLYRIKMI